MKTNIIKFLAVCFLLVGISALQTTQVQAQEFRQINGIGHWDGSTCPTVPRSGGWLNLFIKPFPTEWGYEQTVNSEITVEIAYRYGGRVSAHYTLCSNGLDVTIPQYDSQRGQHFLFVTIKNRANGDEFSSYVSFMQ